MGERVGERTDSMRCVVLETPRYDDGGNIELVLQQQDEEVFGEKFGLVLDYHDAGDVILVPPPTPPPTPPTCTRVQATARPGQSFTGSSLQVLGSGGTGRLTYALQWTSGDPGLVIDSTTGYITGTLPSSTVQTYVGAATVTDSKGLTGSCSVVVTTSNLGEAPTIVLTGVAPELAPNGSDTWTAEVEYPAVVSTDYVGTAAEEWTFSLTSGSDSSFQITSAGQGTTAFQASARVGSQRLGRVVASHPRGFSLEADLIVRVIAASTCNVNFRPITAKRNRVLNATSIFASTTFNTGSTGPAKVALRAGDTMPTGLTLSEAGEVSGTATAPAGRYRVRVTVTDSSSTAVTCTSVGAFDVFVTETRVPPTVTVSECAATFNLTDVRTLNVTTSGFSGSLTCTVQGPSWLSCAPAARGSAHTHVLTAATDRQVGNYPYVVTVTDSAGARAFASCSIRVSRDVIPPLSMEDKVLDAKVGSQWVGNLIVRGR